METPDVIRKCKMLNKIKNNDDYDPGLFYKADGTVMNSIEIPKFEKDFSEKDIKSIDGRTIELSKLRKDSLEKDIKPIDGGTPLRGTCYNCWSPKHHYLDCPIPKEGVFCFWCGRRGSIIKDCPNCSERYHSSQKMSKTKDNPEDKVTVVEEVLTEKKETRSRRHRSSGRSNKKSNKELSNDAKDNEFVTLIEEEYVNEDQILNSDEEDKLANWDLSMMAESFYSLDCGTIGSCDPVQDFINLVDSIKHLSIRIQEMIILQVIEERKRIAKKKDEK